MREELMKPYSLTAQELAREIHVETNLIVEIVNKKKDITADLAARLALYFQIGSDFWLNCQRDYNAKLSELRSKDLAREIRPRQTF